MLPRFVALPAGEVRAQLPRAAPSKAESIECILNDFERLILPGITHWNHPAFFAYFAITGSGPGILGELLASALNVNAMLWQTSPAATELEECVLDWLREMLGLPADFKGVIGVVMQRHPGALFHDPFCESGLRAMQILPLDQWRHLLDRLSVQMVERETSGHMTADHWQYAFAGRVRDLRRGMQRRRRRFRWPTLPGSAKR